MMTRVAVVALCCSGIVFSCGKKEPAKPTEGIVAKVGEQTISRAAFESQLARQPDSVRVRYSSLERKRELLDTLVRQLLLADAARREGVDQDPEVQDLVQKVLVQRLLQKKLAPVAPSESELHEFYVAHHDEFVRPERVRLSVVVWPAANAKGEAQAALARMLAMSASARSTAFVSLVRQRSEHEGSRVLDGDLGLRTRPELAQQWGAVVADAGFALGELGALTIVEADRGLLLLQLTGRQPGEERSFESVKSSLASRLTAEARTKALDALVEELRRTATVVIDDAALESVPLAATAPALPPP